MVKFNRRAVDGPAARLQRHPYVASYLVGAVASVCNITIHAMVMVAVIRVTRIVDELATSYQSLRLIAVPPSRS